MTNAPTVSRRVLFVTCLRSNEISVTAMSLTADQLSIRYVFNICRGEHGDILNSRGRTDTAARASTIYAISLHLCCFMMYCNEEIDREREIEIESCFACCCLKQITITYIKYGAMIFSLEEDMWTQQLKPTQNDEKLSQVLQSVKNY